ncbi:MAG: Rpn family recombination-promoting nuclease/putative transposase [Bacteroidales bacterium]|nr:Rpn family recombination-promoting nuclease/putative transposase [Bacteroidales bacterium]
MSKYFNPYTDFGFKKLFGTELNKDLLISFLNALFEKNPEIPHDEITDITYLNSEQLGRTAADRKAIFDVYCTTKSGNRFIVEMQNVFQQFFKDRSVYYSSFPIRDMAKKDKEGERWNYELQAVYTVGILNFVFKDNEKKDEKGEVLNEFSDDDLLHIVMLTDRITGKVFYNKLVYFYLEMPKFKKTREELVTMYDKWLFVLKNLSKLMERPKELQEAVFRRVFEIAEISMMSAVEHLEYEESLNALWDITNAMEDSEKKGFFKGKEEGEKIGMEKGEKIGMEKGFEKGRADAMREMARTLKSIGKMTIDEIADTTGLPVDEIKTL